MNMNFKERLASIFQKASQKEQVDLDAQVLKTINSVLETKGTDFRLRKEYNEITVKREIP